MLDQNLEASLLFDFYGELLSPRQREVMSLYHEENLTLAEIAAEFGISRAAVHDSLKKAEKALSEYEEKLGLVARFVKTSEAIAEIDRIIDEVTSGAENGGECRNANQRSEAGFDDDISKNLQKIKKIIDELEG